MEGGGLRHRAVTVVGSVTTARLEGRRLSAGDFETLCSLHRDSSVMATLGGVRSDERTRVYLDENLAHWDRHGHGLWIFHDRVSGQFVGRGGLRRVTIEGAPEIEVAYALVHTAWGKGFATEIARASVETGFRQLGLTNLVAFTEPDNRASRRVMEKVGLVYERDIAWHGMSLVLHRIRAS